MDGGSKLYLLGNLCVPLSSSHICSRNALLQWKLRFHIAGRSSMSCMNCSTFKTIVDFFGAILATFFFLLLLLLCLCLLFFSYSAHFMTHARLYSRLCLRMANAIANSTCRSHTSTHCSHTQVHLHTHTMFLLTHINAYSYIDERAKLGFNRPQHMGTHCSHKQAQLHAHTLLSITHIYTHAQLHMYVDARERSAVRESSLVSLNIYCSTLSMPALAQTHTHSTFTVR